MKQQFLDWMLSFAVTASWLVLAAWMDQMPA